MRTRSLPQSEAAYRKAKLLPALPEAGAAKELGYYSQLGLMPPQGSLRALSLSRFGTVSGLLTEALAGLCFETTAIFNSSENGSPFVTV